MRDTVEILVWVALGLVIYSYAIYPILLVVVSGLKQALRDVRFVLNGNDRRHGECARKNSEIAEDELPNVSVVISAYNEEDCIKERIENLLSLDYPIEKIQLLIGSDGSADKTAEIASQVTDDRLQFIDFKENRGKASVLNDLVARAQGDVVVLSDANTHFEPDAIKQLIRHFGREEVGAVCGELRLVACGSGENLDGVYWKYERILKFFESRLGGLVGANGAIYAIRKKLYTPIAPDTIVDDFTIAIKIALNGHRVLYDPEAIAVEEVAPSSGDEFHRRVRIGSGNYQALHRFPQLLNPKYGFLSWVYLSHKVLRWETPAALLLALIGCSYLATSSTFYLLFSVLQIVVYVLSYKSRNSVIQNKLLRLVVFWVNMNIALGLGAKKYYRGSAKGTWDSTKR